MKILVTGAAGYIGSMLCSRLLGDGHHVLAFDDLSSGASSLLIHSLHPRFVFIHGDVRNEKGLAGHLSKVDAIFPLAGVVGAPACDKDPNRAERVNLFAIQQMMLARAKDQRVIFPTTNSGYGTKTERREPCTEETPMEPISLYGRLKCAAEECVLSYENTVSLRLATVFGVSHRTRRDLLVNGYVWEAITKRGIGVFDGHHRRNFVHVEDVCRIFSQLLTSEVSGCFNLGNDGANLTKMALAHLVASFRPGTSIYEIARIDPDKRDYVVSSEKLLRHGFAATMSLEYGIEQLFRAYKTMPEAWAA